MTYKQFKFNKSHYSSPSEIYVCDLCNRQCTVSKIVGGIKGDTILPSKCLDPYVTEQRDSDKTNFKKVKWLEIKVIR